MFLRILSLIVALLLPLLPLTIAAPASAATALPCSATGGTWRKGELNMYMFDVEQADSMLVVGPNAKTILIDLGEPRFNTTGASTNATSVATKIRSICGTGQNPVFIDYFISSHLHLDHIGYAAVPGDTTNYGNGIYQLLNPSGLGFKVGQYITRDAGTWVDTDRNGTCKAGTSDIRSDEIQWTNVGTISTTATRNLCWLYGPTGQADRANIQGRVLTLKNNQTWPSIDLGSGARAAIINANGKGSTLVDGITPISANYSNSSLPTSENDYSVAVKLSYGKYVMATAGDTDGEYSTSSFGYTYNNIEARLGPLYGNVDSYRANHHGSQHSSNATFVGILKPETVFISCGSNTYGHPTNQALSIFRAVKNDRGTGADMFITNNPCSPTQSDGSATNYTGILGSNGDVVIATSSQGNTYTVTYPGGTKTYTSYGSAGSGGGGGTAGDPSQVRINEYMMAPTSGNEWVELYNPTTTAINIGGLYVDDLVNGGGAPRIIPAGTMIPANGLYVFDLGTTSFLNNTGSEEVRFLKIVNNVETVYDRTTYNLGSTQSGRVFRRIGNGGAWCTTISTNVTRGTANPTSCP